MILGYNAISTSLRQRFTREVRSTFNLLRNTPELFAHYEGQTTQSKYRRALLDGFPYTVIYEVDQHRVSIVAFAHTSREPGYWEKR